MRSVHNAYTGLERKYFNAFILSYLYKVTQCLEERISLRSIFNFNRHGYALLRSLSACPTRAIRKGQVLFTGLYDSCLEIMAANYYIEILLSATNLLSVVGKEGRRVEGVGTFHGELNKVPLP